MKWKTLAVLALTVLAGCGGGDDDEDSANDGGGATTAADTAAADTAAAEPAPQPVKGKVTEEKLIKAAALKPKGDHYVWSDGCEVRAVAATKADVKKLQKTAENPRNVIPNKSNSAAIEIMQATYPCAVHASLFLRGVP
jgi:hypothetical protein